MEGDDGHIEEPVAGDGAGDGDDARREDAEDVHRQPKGIGDEDGAVSEMQTKVENEMGAAVSQDPSGASSTQAEKEEADARSIFVGNVDYACTTEEIQQHFQSCGIINRVTILTNKFGQPKGYAYVEFREKDAVQNAILLNETELHGRQLKVSAKRTNLPGMKQYRGRRPGPPMADGIRRPLMPQPFSGYGKSPRVPRPTGYRPYN